ncbi:hypothetical protein E1B28_001180 [Marasmius oreades]|uniref:Ribosome biogenesis protein SLX9 n=1 Tax=Marasmius oreades TaxID=181124 RepID=A0A9P7V382_9AGAR|nr:uncharacterized protein E1B28_001180 [Marasmius oreades]KAG7099322.1 hypothetical protein E1B28_001180 [Marasmius oreades]
MQPKDRQKRTPGHASSSLRLAKKFATPDSQQIERAEIESLVETSANNLLAPPSIRESTSLRKQMRREALLERLPLTQSPYSKSHLRRVKRKAREQLANGLSDLQTALDSLDSSEVKVPTPPGHPKPSIQSTSEPTLKTISGQIGEGKGATLSGQQRKRVFQTERMRHPLILSNSHFSSNPFQTIRTHAENTLVKHSPPES